MMSSQFNLQSIKQEITEYEYGVPAVEDAEQEDDFISKYFPCMKGIWAPIIERDAVEEEAFDQDYDKTWTDIFELLRISGAPHMRKLKTSCSKMFKDSYPSIIISLESRAETRGFDNNELMAIWNMASDPHINANCTQRRKLLFSMIPKMMIQSEVIEQMVTWLIAASSNNFKPTVVTGAYQLLCLYAEYALIDDDEIYNGYILHQLLKADVDKWAIPWKMYTFRNMVTPSGLDKSHVNMLTNLLSAKDAKKTHIEDVKATIGFCQHLRPDLFELDVNSIVWNGKLRMLNIPSDVRARFYNCLMRIKSVTLPNQHPLYKYVFPEFLPAVSSKKKRPSTIDKMLQFLESDEGTIELALTPVYLNMFSEWLRNVFFHRLQDFFLPTSREDALRYVFLLERCYMITTVLGKGLEVINTWLVQMLITWDFSMLKDFVYPLLQYVEPKQVMPFAESVSRTLKNRFINDNWASLYIWKSLSDLAMIWLKQSYVVNSEGYHEGFRWLFDLLGDLSCSVASNKIHEDELTKSICYYYVWIFMKKSEILRIISEGYFTKYSIRLLTCFAINQNLNYVSYICDAAKEDLKENQDVLDAISYVHNSIDSQTLVPSILKDFPLEFQTSIQAQLNTVKIDLDTVD